nr:MAG TPA: hypothetical protein [Caudoviricetes sp.]
MVFRFSLKISRKFQISSLKPRTLLRSEKML